MTTIFRLDTQYYAQKKKATALKSLLGLAIAFVAITIFDPTSTLERFNLYDIIGKLIGFAIGYVIVQILISQKLRNQYDSYSLTVFEDHFEYEEHKVPNSKIYFRAINEIVQKPDGSMIAVLSNGSHLSIPLEIERRKELEMLLHAQVPIRSIPQPFLEKYWFLSIAVSVICYTTIAMSTFKIAILTSLVTLILFVLYRYFYGKKHYFTILLSTKNLLIILALYVAIVVFRLSMLP